jgi:hypothetical protein
MSQIVNPWGLEMWYILISVILASQIHSWSNKYPANDDMLYHQEDYSWSRTTPDVCPEPTPVAQYDSLFQRTPMNSARGCRELLGNQHRVVAGVLASKSIIMPFYSLLHILRGWHMSFVPCVDERELCVVVDYAMFGQTAANDIHDIHMFYGIFQCFSVKQAMMSLSFRQLQWYGVVWCCLIILETSTNVMIYLLVNVYITME